MRFTVILECDLGLLIPMVDYGVFPLLSNSCPALNLTLKVLKTNRSVLLLPSIHGMRVWGQLLLATTCV